MSGFDVRFAEPDLVIRSEAWSVAVAAKRPRSPSSFGKCVGKAVRQLRRAELPGIVAIDASFAVYRGQCINTNDAAGAMVFVKAAGDRVASQILRDQAAVLRTEGVLGILVQVYLPVLNLGHPLGPQVLTAVRWTVAPLAHDPRSMWIADLAARSELGLFGVRKADEEKLGGLSGLMASGSSHGVA